MEGGETRNQKPVRIVYHCSYFRSIVGFSRLPSAVQFVFNVLGVCPQVLSPPLWRDESGPHQKTRMRTGRHRRHDPALRPTGDHCAGDDRTSFPPGSLYVLRGEPGVCLRRARVTRLSMMGRKGTVELLWRIVFGSRRDGIKLSIAFLPSRPEHATWL